MSKCLPVVESLWIVFTFMVGIIVGWLDGWPVGCVVGWPVGWVVGCDDGRGDGRNVGDAVGWWIMEFQEVKIKCSKKWSWRTDAEYGCCRSKPRCLPYNLALKLATLTV